MELGSMHVPEWYLDPLGKQLTTEAIRSRPICPEHNPKRSIGRVQVISKFLEFLTRMLYTSDTKRLVRVQKIMAVPHMEIDSCIITRIPRAIMFFQAKRFLEPGRLEDQRPTAGAFYA